MAEAIDQIAAAIPIRTFRLIRLENAGPEEQVIPGDHQHAEICGKTQLGRRRFAAERRQRREVGPDRGDVRPRQPCEIRVGEGRVIVRAIGVGALAQRAIEIGIAPVANAGIAIRGEVCGVDPTKRGVDPLSPGERLGRVGGMAARTIAGFDQRLAAGDRLLRGLGRRGAKSERTAQKKTRKNRPHQ